MAALRLAFILLCFFSTRPRCSCGFVFAAAATVVTSVPGFDGSLPSRLETGYVSVDEENGAELFYYFIESERDPRRDPVLLWLTGGDHCSVLSGLLFEIGPLKLIIEPYDGRLPRLRYNPYSWTKVASILFVDSPVGAGFSFARNPKGYDVGEISASLQLKKFLAKWFTEHPDYLANPFYIGGDSFAGKIAPYLAQKISEDIEAGLRPSLNLKGYLVGNPSTGESIDLVSRVPYAHGFGIISDQLYESYAAYLSYFWANSNMTRETIGIKKGSVDEWMRCHNGDLPYSRDIIGNIKYHRNVTSKGYRALVYSGDHDAIVPFLGTQAWVRSLNFPIVDDWRAWHLDGQSAGFTIAYANNLTFATVKGAGHTAPEYEPERCFAMFKRWISNQPL